MVAFVGTDGKWIYALSGSPVFCVVDARQGKAVVHKPAILNGKEIKMGTAKLGRKGFLNSGLAVWVVLAQPPQFDVTQVIDLAQSAKVPAGRYGDLSTYDLKWGESLK